jgi:hypothetical protein
VSAKLIKRSREYIGPCPTCGGDDCFAANPTKKCGLFNCHARSAILRIVYLIHESFGSIGFRRYRLTDQE